MKKILLILHNIRSVHNVGSIFRTADAVGVEKIYLTGYTPAPVDRFGRARKDFIKVSLGAEKTVPWEAHADTLKLVRTLKRKGVSIVALEQDARSVDYKKVRPVYPVALVVGNETEGISDEILTVCDVIAEIPMRGKKESLNVSVAAGVVLFRLFDR